MTDYKEYGRGSNHRSLYFGLLYNLFVGALLAILVFGVIAFPSWYIISNYYVTPDRQSQRREEYLNSLQNYIEDHAITMATSDEIGGWIRENSCVYLLVYQNDEYELDTSRFDGEVLAPGAKDKISEFSGSRVYDSLGRDELIATATANGYYRIDLVDGSVIVALNEYSENRYFSTFYTISIMAGIFTFVLALLNYIRVIIDRIKRFESDITIVSEIDMGYEIVSEGADEIANLSTKVETMRRRMLDNIKSEQEAREANTELITSLSHDIRTPLTVLMGYIEMMKDQAQGDDIMQSYVSATESTALRLKKLSDDMFRYSLAFGDTKKSVKLEEYDLTTLLEQLFFEHFLLMREMGYEILTEGGMDQIPEGTTVHTDAPNIMRIVDNVFSNLRKYADPSEPIVFSIKREGPRMIFECRNKIRKDTVGTESNGIGLKTCVRLASVVAEKFEYNSDGEYFNCRLTMPIQVPATYEEFSIS